MTVRRLLCLLLLALAAGLAAGADEVADYEWQLPAWVPRPRVPDDNPMTQAKVALGRLLFYDKRLSFDESLSCGSCHQQDKAFTDGRATSPGITGEAGVRSAMALVNLAYLPTLTWANPLLTRLETQALVPIFGAHPVEMGMEGKEELLLGRLAADAEYPALFRAAFPDAAVPISLDTLTKALASFERSLLSFNAPYYRYKYLGEREAMSEAAVRGESLFFSEQFECYHCHGGLNFTDNLVHLRLPFEEVGFHNTGLYNLDGKGAYPVANPGLREVTDNPADEGKFRTPTLLNIAVTAPYMHDGSIATLEAVLTRHYALRGKAVSDGNEASPLRDPLLVGYDYTQRDIDDLLAFLHALTDEAFLGNPAHAAPGPAEQRQ
jgi:cytochrome c peroxidase